MIVRPEPPGPDADPPVHRFFTPHLDRHETLSDDSVGLDADQARHAQTVLRLGVGDRVEVFDGCGRVGVAEIEQWTEGAQEPATLRMTAMRLVPPPATTVDVACAVPKGPRGTAMAAALSQVGADRLVPLHCRRASVDPGRINRRRFERTAIETAKQCGRAYLLQVDSPATIDELIRESHDVRLIGSPIAGEPTDDGKLAQRLRDAGKVLILIGPEGGWTDQEQAVAVAGGCTPWSFGIHVMRIETASAAAVAIVRYLASGHGR